MPQGPANGSENGRLSSDDLGAYMELRDELIASLQQHGVVRPVCAALLGEVAEALRLAAKLRAAAEDEPFTRSERSGRSYIHPGIAAADLEVRRAALLLARVAAMATPLPAQPPPALEEPAEDEPEDPFADLDALERGEVVRRATRSRRNREKE